jgi:transcription antitermination factor NusG
LHKDCQKNVQYFDAEMRPLTYDQVKPYLPKKSSKKQSEIGIAEADQVKVINPSVKSIQGFSANGKIYEIVAD